MSRFEVFVWILGALFLLLLSSVLLLLNPFDTHLADQVTAKLASSGVSHDVTAVLLNFRSLDTLLEVAVIVLSLIAIGVLNPLFVHNPPSFSSKVIHTFTALIFPVIAISALYILYSGAFQSGGAFQGAALLGGGYIIINLNNPRYLEKIQQFYIRIFYTIGLFIFLALGVVTLFWGSFLQYPQGYAYFFILCIEAVLMFSLSTILGAYFIQAVQRIKQ